MTDSPDSNAPDTASAPEGDSGLSADERSAAEALERFRQTGIRLDREGRLWHEGGQVEHDGLRRAFLRWLDVLDDGRPVLRLDETRYAYLEVEDAHLLVVSARWQGDRAFVTSNDGAEQELEYRTLAVGADEALYCRLRGDRLDARVTTPAYYAIAERIEPNGSGGFVLAAAGQRFAIGPRS